MNKKLVISIVLFSLFCLTIVSALNFKEAFDNVVSEPLNNLITGNYFDNFRTGPIPIPTPPTSSEKIIVGVAEVSNYILNAQNCGALGTYDNIACRAKRWCINQGYKTGIQSEFNNIDNKGEIYCFKGEGVTKFVVGKTVLEAQNCGALGTYENIACRAKRWCETQGYKTGIQSELGVTDAEIYCLKGDDIVVYESIPKSQLQQTTCGAVNTVDYLMCRAKRYCTQKDHITGIQSEFGFDYGDIYCITGSKEYITPISTCTDNPVKDNLYLKGQATDKTGVTKEDRCLTYNYDTKKHIYTGYYPIDSCKAGTYTLGGAAYSASCAVVKTQCGDNELVEEKKAEVCPTGTCHLGQCSCENDNDCGTGYTCTKWNVDLREMFCEETTIESAKCMGCILNNICYPMGARKGNEYCEMDEIGNYNWESQKPLASACINTWECESGLCVNGQCTELTAAGTTIVTTDCVGCIVQNKCLPMGTRKAGKYCGLKDDGTYDLIDQIAQDASDISCENDYECKTNVCIQGECSEPKQDTGLLMMIWCKVTLGLGTGCD